MMTLYLLSDETYRQIKLFYLQNSPLVNLLLNVVDQYARLDDWCYLAHAGRHTRIHEPDEVENIKARYGCIRL
jgi:hypothetical protein